MFMIPTNDEIREEARRNYNRRNPFGGGIHNVTGERDFIAGAEWVLQKLQQASVSGALPDDSELEDWLFDGYERNEKNLERLKIGKVVRDRIAQNLNSGNDR
jgi:hypothetical protein